MLGRTLEARESNRIIRDPDGGHRRGGWQ